MTTKAISHDSHCFSVQLGLLLLKMEASRVCSNLCLLILESFLLLANDSNLSLLIYCVVLFVLGTSLTFSGFFLFFQLSLFAGLSLLGSLLPVSSHLSHGIAPEPASLPAVFPGGRLLVPSYICGFPKQLLTALFWLRL